MIKIMYRALCFYEHNI